MLPPPERRRIPAFRHPIAVIAAFAALLSAGALGAQGNPFTSAGNAGPAPVRAGRASGRIVELQIELREAIAVRIRAWEGEGSAGALLSILAISFVYGLIHAAGPGHRKTVVFSLYLAKKARAMEPFLVGILLAALHAGTSIVVLAVLRRATGAVSGRSADLSVLMEGISYSVLVVMSLGLLIHAIADACRGKRDEAKIMGTGALILSGIYPCPGAILILVLAASLGAFGLGTAAVAAMSLGMSVPIIASGYLAWFGRTSLFARLKENERLIGRIANAVEISGYALLLGFSLFIAWPFVLSLFR
jgi:ABC-type nickel/cobalt efflux system permease component RcnA